MSGEAACPVNGCGLASKYLGHDEVDIGIGFQQCGPDEWECPTHGGWCYLLDNTLAVEFPQGRSER